MVLGRDALAVVGDLEAPELGDTGAGDVHSGCDAGPRIRRSVGQQVLDQDTELRAVRVALEVTGRDDHVVHAAPEVGLRCCHHLGQADRLQVHRAADPGVIEQVVDHGGHPEGARTDTAEEGAGRSVLQLRLVLAQLGETHDVGQRTLQIMADTARELTEQFVAALQLLHRGVELTRAQLEIEDVHHLRGQCLETGGLLRGKRTRYVVEDAEGPERHTLLRQQGRGGVETHQAEAAVHERVLREPRVTSAVLHHHGVPVLEHLPAQRVLARAHQRFDPLRGDLVELVLGDHVDGAVLRIAELHGEGHQVLQGPRGV